MGFAIVVELFDCVQAEAARRSSGCHIADRQDPLSLDTRTGLPAALDIKARCSPARILETARLFGRSATVPPPPAFEFNPLANDFSPGSPVKRAHALQTDLSTIKPLFTPLRKLDYRFSKISIDWQDMIGGDVLKGSIDAGFGIIHLLRDAQDIADADFREDATHTSDGRLLAVLAIPSVMNINDFLFFVEPAAESISQIRILRDEMPNKCMALLQFHSRSSAMDFKDAFHGQPFWQMFQDEICQVVAVSSVQVRSTIEPPFSSLTEINAAPTSTKSLATGTIELPTCVVCLERMDSNITGLVTIPCQHTFHCSCLSKWANGKCPVCRYTQSKLKTNAPLPDRTMDSSACDECGANTSLWMCLICGHVGCGRYGGKHGIAHYHASSHNYAMELESQRVWDYLGDAYVHRLIQNRTDGHLVELPSMSSSHDPASKQVLGPDNADVAAQEKLERMGEEFSHVLSSQLETQRSYYADKLSETRDEINVMVQNLAQSEERAERWRLKSTERKTETREEAPQETELKAAHQQLAIEVSQLRNDVLPVMARQKTRAESRADEALARNKLLAKDLDAEKEITRGLMAHVSQLKTDLQTERGVTRTLALELEDLKSTVHELTTHIAMSDRIQKSNDPDLVNSDLVISALPDAAERRKKKSKKPKKPPNAVSS